MKKLNKRMLTVLASILTLVAASVASTACFWGFHQPEEPMCLREE